MIGDAIEQEVGNCFPHSFRGHFDLNSTIITIWSFYDFWAFLWDCGKKMWCTLKLVRG
jgi:hypothetical protein